MNDRVNQLTKQIIHSHTHTPKKKTLILFISPPKNPSKYYQEPTTNKIMESTQNNLLRLGTREYIELHHMVALAGSQLFPAAAIYA